MNWKSTAVVSGATLLATWLGWTSTPQIPVAGDVRTVSRDAGSTRGVDIQHQADRLQVRVRGEVAFHDPSRNPFRFGTHLPAPASPRAARSAAAVASAPSAAAAPVISLTLSGIAADTVDGSVQRTAIITAPSGLLLVKEGDHVADYTVAHIDDAAVHLVGADGSTRTLTLKP